MRGTTQLLAGTMVTIGLVLLPMQGAVHAASGGSKVNATASGGPANTPFTLEYIASVEGVSPAALNQDLQAGETILQVAGAKYGSAADLAVALMVPVKRKLDYAAASGKIDPTEPTAQYNKLLQATETLVVTPHPVLDTGAAKGKGSPQPALGNIKLTMISAAATACDTTTDALIAALSSGSTSILNACQTTNPTATVAGLSAAILAAVKAQLDASVASGAITADDESSFLSSLPTTLSKWLTATAQTSGGKQKS